MESASEEEEERRRRGRIKGVLEEIEPLPGRISTLLLRHGGARRLTAADVRLWEFIVLEVRGLVTSLSELLLSELGRDSAHSYFFGWLQNCSHLASKIGRRLRQIEQGTPRGCQAQLCRAAAHCFSRGASLSEPFLDELGYVLYLLSQTAESPRRYKHLLLAGDGDRTPTTTSTSVQPYPFAVDVGGIPLVGIEGALRNKKLRWFMADRENDKTLKVISMVGPAGVGKTALAMEVYRQLQQIGGGHYFQCCATAKVSQWPNMKELLKHILSQIHKPAAEALESSIEPSQITTLELLAGDIEQCLQHKRYLIVIDDVWKELERYEWYIIESAFPQDSPGSRIIITTQLRSVAQLWSSHFSGGIVHEVKPLSDLDSERLLFRKAFGSEDASLPENLKQVCDEILRRCEGIPLFIIGMAAWLQEQQWEVQHISTNYSPEIVPKLPKQFEQALVTIYHYLPYPSKVLLMSMIIFPEGYIFDKDSLIRKLINEQLINDDRRGGFFDLDDRNVVTRVATTHEYTCQEEENCHWQVNYFMLQFLAAKSANKGILCTSGTLSSVAAAAGGKKTLWMSLHLPDLGLPRLLGEMDLSHTRSLAISGKVVGIPLDKFIYLAVLDLEGWQCFKDEDMSLICKLFLLRHLILRNTGVSKLPPEIKELQELQTLDISHTSICELPLQVCELSWLKGLDLRSTQVRQLPEQIWKLQFLRCLLVGDDGVNRYETVTEIPEEIRSLKYLRTLATVDLSPCSPSLVEALGGLEALEVLAITWSFHQCTDGTFQQALRSSLENWRRLKSLTIHCRLGCCMDFLDSWPDRHGTNMKKFKVSGGRFARIPQLFDRLDYLIFIEITVCTLVPGDLGIIGNLFQLECLVLGLHFIPEAEIVINREGFRRLQRLSIGCRVPWLTFMQGAMPELTFLELKIGGSPASQESIPSGISNLLSLSDVALCYHANYTNSPSIKMTFEALRKQAAENFNLVINGVQDQEEHVQELEKDLPRVAESEQTEG